MTQNSVEGLTIKLVDRCHARCLVRHSSADKGNDLRRKWLLAVPVAAAAAVADHWRWWWLEGGLLNQPWMISKVTCGHSDESESLLLSKNPASDLFRIQVELV